MGNLYGATKRHGTIKNSEGFRLKSIDNISLDYDQIVNLIRETCRDDIELPADLIIEILCKLPVKSLIRLKSVCKSWKFMIDSPVFINIHLHKKNHLHRYSLYFKDCRSFFPFEILYIVGACNGIICLVIIGRPKDSLLLFNPSTREFSFLPDECRGLRYGFCYLSKTQEYHIISFYFKLPLPCNKIDMTTMVLGKNNTSLRNVKGIDLPGWFTTRTSYRQVISGTSMLWLGFDHEDEHKGSDIVIWYDLIEQKFSKMDVPPSDSCSKSDRILDVLDDSVIMFVTPKTTPTFFDMWILVVDHGSKDRSWMKYRKIGPLETNAVIKPEGVCWNDSRVLCMKYMPQLIKLDSFYYDLELNQIEDRKTTDPPTLRPENLCEVNYVESLVSIHRLLIYTREVHALRTWPIMQAS